MRNAHTIYHKLLLILMALSIVFIFTSTGHGSNKKNNEVMNEAELQVRLMGFADRFAAFISQGFEYYDETLPANENRRIVLGDSVYSMYSAFVIAAEADPDAALLDMVVMVTLGRMIYEEHYLPKFGPEIESVVNGFRLAEKDIWDIVALILEPDQKQGLYELIQEWRENHPQELQFSYMRFDEFTSDRAKSKLARIWKPSGLFKSVRIATKQVETARLLAERTVFLGTRMPLLIGYFVDTWSSQLLISPEFKNILNDLNRFVNMAEQMPQKLATESNLLIDNAMAKLSTERQNTMDQMANLIARERKNTINDFLGEEARITNILSEVKNTITEGNKLMVAANSLASQLDLGSSSESPKDRTPFDINDYRETIAEANITIAELNTLVGTVNQLLNSNGVNDLPPKFEATMIQTEDMGKRLIDHSFQRGIFLIIVWVCGYILAKLIVNYFSRKKST